MKKSNSSKTSYIYICQKPIVLSPSKKPNSSSFRASDLLRPLRLGYLLLVIAICTGLSVLTLGFFPLAPCNLLHDYRLQTGRIFEKIERFDQSSGNGNLSSQEEFWRQPDGLGFRLCLNFSDEYHTAFIDKGTKRRFLKVVVSGGLNQQRNQIIDAVVIARILGASLVVPILQINPVWGDESKFSDIFDEEQFKETLKYDVDVVSTLPVNHHRRRHRISSHITPSSVDEAWVRTQFTRRLNKHGVLILQGFDSRLSKDLKPDLQKLRCKVAFEALKFRPWIEKLGVKLAERMAQGGPYVGLHLRLEKDVWVRTGCLPGLGKDADLEIHLERERHPELLTARTRITAGDRYMAGLCPLNAVEITRLLKALGASNNTRIYWAGGEPFGGKNALQSLSSQFPHLYNKWGLAKEGELDDIKHRSSILAAIDYVVCLKSQVFMANHGGNMARLIQGHRAYQGHKKHIAPNKKQLVQLLMNKSMEEMELEERIRMLHPGSRLGSPLLRKPGRDVLAFPVPDCMCSTVEERQTN